MEAQLGSSEGLLEKLQQSSTNDILNRSYASLLSAIIGDAVGAIIHEDPSEENFKLALQMPGGGKNSLKPGQGVNGLELSFSLGFGLKNGQSVMNLNEICKQYFYWLKSPPFSITSTIAQAFAPLCLLKEGAAKFEQQFEDSANKVKSNAQKNCKDSLTNSCMQRLTPLAIWGYNLKIQDLETAVKNEVELTHPHSFAVESSFCYVYGLTLLVKNGGDLKATLNKIQEWIQEKGSKELLDLWEQISHISEFNQLQQIINKELKAIVNNEQSLNEIKITLSFFFVLLKQPNEKLVFKDTLFEIINSSSGFKDNLLTILGGALGAVIGINGIPEELIKIILNCNLADANYKRPEQFTPKNFILLVEELNQVAPQKLIVIPDKLIQIELRSQKSRLSLKDKPNLGGRGSLTPKSALSLSQQGTPNNNAIQRRTQAQTPENDVQSQKSQNDKETENRNLSYGVENAEKEFKPFLLEIQDKTKSAHQLTQLEQDQQGPIIKEQPKQFKQQVSNESNQDLQQHQQKLQQENSQQKGNEEEKLKDSKNPIENNIQAQHHENIQENSLNAKQESANLIPLNQGNQQQVNHANQEEQLQEDKETDFEQATYKKKKKLETTKDDPQEEIVTKQFKKNKQIAKKELNQIDDKDNKHAQLQQAKEAQVAQKDLTQTDDNDNKHTQLQQVKEEQVAQKELTQTDDNDNKHVQLQKEEQIVQKELNQVDDKDNKNAQLQQVQEQQKVEQFENAKINTDQETNHVNQELENNQKKIEQEEQNTKTQMDPENNKNQNEDIKVQMKEEKIQQILNDNKENHEKEKKIALNNNNQLDNNNNGENKGNQNEKVDPLKSSQHQKYQEVADQVRKSVAREVPINETKNKQDIKDGKVKEKRDGTCCTIF